MHDQHMKIAILGATGYIGRSMAAELALDPKVTLTLFTRNEEKTSAFVEHNIIAKDRVSVASYEDFAVGQYDVILNCTGIGSPRAYKENPAAIFEVTERIDAMVIAYLIKRPESIYINLSTGSVYGLAAQGIVDEESQAVIDVNKILPSAYYSIAKINSEAKHRAYADLSIVDLRVFSFFSRFADSEDSFLLSDIVKALRRGEPMKTGPSSVVRDYVCPSELARIVTRVIETGAHNDVYDVVSAAPVSKFDLLDRVKANFAFDYIVEEGGGAVSPTGNKNEYYSKSKKLEQIGYSPKLSSLDGILEELQLLTTSFNKK